MVSTVLMLNSWSFMIRSSCWPLPVKIAPWAMCARRFLNSLAATTWPEVKVFFTGPPSCGKSTRA
ncbi:hypothetical protein D3C78_1837140 [compost metagenome]